MSQGCHLKSCHEKKKLHAQENQNTCYSDNGCFFLCLGTEGIDVAVDKASLRGRPLGRLSVGVGLPVGVAPELQGGGEGPLSEGSRLFSSDDILFDPNTFYLFPS